MNSLSRDITWQVNIGEVNSRSIVMCNIGYGKVHILYYELCCCESCRNQNAIMEKSGVNHNSMTTTSDQLFGYGSLFTDILFTSGDGTQKHNNQHFYFFLSQSSYLCHLHCCTPSKSIILLKLKL